uniref:Uncharacterized protein n=1 Tax=Opuntia streptacantha TaxID=393608 RepID=A0A7C8YUM2_OPUST
MLSFPTKTRRFSLSRSCTPSVGRVLGRRRPHRVQSVMAPSRRTPETASIRMPASSTAPQRTHPLNFANTSGGPPQSAAGQTLSEHTSLLPYFTNHAETMTPTAGTTTV